MSLINTILKFVMLSNDKVYYLILLCMSRLRVFYEVVTRTNMRQENNKVVILLHDS